jgi:antitoxin component YwqK of YwqJK toxin-antitoxin module
MGFSNSFCQSKIYVKNYFENGKIESEGWIKDNQKIDYWFYYYENGNKKEEGHYVNNKKSKWWLMYDDNEIIQKKCQFYNNKLDGLAIVYKNGTIIRAEKYKMNIKIKQWESLSAFRKDNTLTSL